MMYQIITSKPSGVVSGVQVSENGPIDWSTELPLNCRLTKGMFIYLTFGFRNAVVTYEWLKVKNFLFKQYF